MMELRPVTGVGVVEAGNDLAALLFRAIDAAGARLLDGDVLVICQKIVSKAEGRTVDLRTVQPSALAQRIAAESSEKDARVVEVVLRETNRVVRMANGHLIVETGPGWVCANAGVDQSNSGASDLVVLLPRDADASARRLTEAAAAHYGSRIAALVTDTFGRPWRQGLVDFALGVAGIAPLLDLRGQRDLDGRELHHTILAQADALAAAAGLLMQKDAGVPAVIVRGFGFAADPAGRGTDLIRPRESDLFR
jgi:coenzyme F420-0:L-glutamate ligase / coenzyme F420-1:gamma-L-glutamate ligase